MTYVLRCSLCALMLVATTACSEPSEEGRVVDEEAYDSLMRQAPGAALDDSMRVEELFRAYAPLAAAYVRPDEAEVRRWADSVLATLTLGEKIGQLFIVNLEARGLRRFVGSPADAVDDYGVGGFLLPRLLGPREAFETTRALQRRSKLPLFFAADYERGVGRYNNALTELPSNMAVGATRSGVFAAAAGRLTAIESRAVGVNLLLAPVVDVNDNPDNPIINIRAYGGDPELVAAMAAAYVREAEAAGVLTTLKHFPGHGNTSIDTHAQMGVVEGDREELARVELLPYERVLGQPTGPAAVMTAHLWIRAFDEEPTPATFSREILTGLLRERFGFDGMIITDDVKMGALQNSYSPEERVIRPLEAGADVILTPANLPRAIGFVEQAVERGRLTEADIDRSVRRILEAKARAGLHEQRQADPALLDGLLEEPLGQHVAQAIADESMTLLREAPEMPLNPGAQRVALVQLANFEGSESIGAAMDRFEGWLGADDAFATSVRLDAAPSSVQTNRLVSAARQADVVVLALYLRLRSGRGEAGLFAGQHELVERLLALETPVVLVTFGNPYAAGTYADAEGILVGYDQTLASVYAAARVLRGEQPASGRLPIRVAPFEYGAGR